MRRCEEREERELEWEVRKIFMSRSMYLFGVAGRWAVSRTPVARE